MQRGLVLVYTGDGKGKTSAALGTAFRACGHDMHVSMVQFVKSPGESGEELAARRLQPEFELVTAGKGFLNIPGQKAPLGDHKRAADEAFAIAQQRVLSGYWDVVILDEINVAIDLGLLDVSRVLSLLASKPKKLHVILTGRGAHADIVAVADVVTEMRMVKHPFDDKGMPAQKGIDY